MRAHPFGGDIHAQMTFAVSKLCTLGGDKIT